MGRLGRLLRALDQNRPVFRNGQLAIERRRLLAGLDVHGNVELAGGFAAEDAMGGGNVGVIAANGGADVAMVGNQIVGGIEAHPAEMRQQHIHPGVGGVGSGAVVIFAAAI